MDELGLKWGTLKFYDIKSEAGSAALDRYFEIENTLSNALGDGNTIITGAALQQDNEEQKKALCDVVDAIDNPQVYLDWDGRYVSKEEAKQYIMEYHKK